ncbi:MAG TPA: DUF5660 family protein [Clostridia bacterium]|nr:DUF5660 family protein [Clostridia bacterium]
MSNSKRNQAKNKPRHQDSFLEAFRELGSDIASTTKDTLVKDGLDNIKQAVWPFNTSGPTNESSLYENEAELEKSYRSRLRQAEVLRREERVLFSRDQEKTQVKVETLQDEIKNLAQAVGELAGQAKEAEIATLQETPVVGKYHLSFFEKLKKRIAELRAQIQESSLWLEAWNKKAKKRNYYWAQFKKSGSKFLLSGDRYMATQAG